MSMSPTALYTSLVALLAIALAARVVLLRRRLRIGIGSGGDKHLQRAVRAHANLMEYGPLALLLLLLLEINGAHIAILHGLGGILLLGRLLHAWGLSRKGGISFGRFYGTALTWLVILAAATTLLVRPALA